jgi:hypothetical protein
MSFQISEAKWIAEPLFVNQLEMSLTHMDWQIPGFKPSVIEKSSLTG